MRDWPGDEVRPVGLTDLDGRFARYRLQASAEMRRALEQSLRRYGQLSPVVVCYWDGCVVLLDGFKRWEAARAVDGIDELLARRIEADPRAAKAAMYGLNCLTRRLHELEEAWIVQALVREDGLTQVQVGELLGRHKSWVSRRLALLEKLSDEVRDELGLGLVSPSQARELIRLPAGNQAETLAAARRAALSATDLRQTVNLVLAAQSRPQVEFVLEQPRAALSQANGELARGRDPRLSRAGDQAARRVGMLLEQLAKLESWLRHDGRAQLQSYDRPLLAPGFRRLAEQSRPVADLSQELAEELER
jgi:ParB-like chromosome segregation protein Spo0J